MEKWSVGVMVLAAFWFQLVITDDSISSPKENNGLVKKCQTEGRPAGSWHLAAGSQGFRLEDRSVLRTSLEVGGKDDSKEIPSFSASNL